MTEKEMSEEIFALCESKAEEFRWIGYEQVTGTDVWECVQARYIKSGEPLLHKLVNDILSLKATQLMNHLTMSAWKEP
ncbi:MULTISPECIES: post-transcriptional regulator [Paenibacillus]|uniref:post-transcriptional regulator n=1 Tax=Paenibacillus TaxID=44249 RepID=UPI00038F6F8B|nr:MULTISPECIES: post-transcriptional regulator [Paenibacillus]KKC47259.1 hypothetical protein VE23_09040 [Paenibacillus sp. D9]CDN42430.1 Uncharacterized protein BN871_BG_00300 [Paenibacillus sp. P22]